MKFYDREKELGILQNQSNRTRGKDFYVDKELSKYAITQIGLSMEYM